MGENEIFYGVRGCTRCGMWFDIFRLVQLGGTNRSIARTLGVSTGTIVHRVQSKWYYDWLYERRDTITTTFEGRVIVQYEDERGEEWLDSR